jgi:hypothetical protein
MTRDDITRRAKAIKQHLHRRSGKSWSVTSDTRSTAYGTIYVEVPRKFSGTPDYRARCEELARLLGFYEDHGGQWGFSAGNDEYLQRAMGALVNPEDCGGCGLREYRWKAPYCPRCAEKMARHPTYD